MCAFVGSIPEVGQQQYKKLLNTQLISCKKPASEVNCRKLFCKFSQVNGKSKPKENSYPERIRMMSNLSIINKLRAEGFPRPSRCVEIFKIEMTDLPECFTTKHHSNKV